MPGMFIPPVQPIPTAPNSFGKAPQGQQQPPQQGQEQHDEGQEQAQMHKCMILCGAIIEALIQKGVIDEEDVHNAISTLNGGDESEEKTPEGGKPEGGGYPGAADTQKGQGAENGKMSPSRQ